jgi:hypothetical protein
MLIIVNVNAESEGISLSSEKSPHSESLQWYVV